MEPKIIFLIVVFICLAISFLLSGMETGVLSLNRIRIRRRMNSGDKSAAALMRYLEDPENFLWTILVGNTVANFTAVSLVVAGMFYWFIGSYLTLLTCFIVFVLLFYSIGDLLPKMLFQQHPNRYCLYLARPFRLVHFGLAPLVSLVTALSWLMLRWTGGYMFTGRLFGSREELQVVMQESAGGFSSEERQMINRVLDLQNISLFQITRPMDKVVAVTHGIPMREVLSVCNEHRLTRLPVWRSSEKGRRIAGIISLKTLLYMPNLDANKPVSQYLKPALYLDSKMRLEQALSKMRRSGHRMAIVLDPYQKELGIVCLEDILKTIFGEVRL
ncbi:MAG: CNNM domain-containing protein [Verrucomicrobia bacterium]|nr:CNNM domain-containing protein [Verrucomicrobiota bacterium]